MQRHRHAKPTIIEAIASFIFKDGQPWDPMTIGRVYGGLESDYSNTPNQKLKSDIQVEKGTGRVTIEPTVGLVWLANREEDRYLKIGPGELYVHTLEPYQRTPEEDGWGAFSSRIIEALNAYQSAVNPDGIERVQLRFIYELAVPSDARGDLGRFYKSPIPSFPGMDTPGSYVARQFYILEDGIELDFMHSLKKGKLYLDFELSQGFSPLLRDQEVTMEQFHKLRALEDKLFNTVLTDASKEEFDEPRIEDTPKA